MQLFLTNSNKRVYPSAKVGDYSTPYIAKGEILNYQVSLYNNQHSMVDCEITIDSKNEILTRLCDFVILKGHSTVVPVHDVDGIDEYRVPEVLTPTNKVSVMPYETRTFWIRVTTKADIKSGEYKDLIKVHCVNKEFGEDETPWEETIEAKYVVSEKAITKKRCIDCLHWFYADSISDYYKLPLWSEEFWAMCKKWMKDYADHGNTYIYLPLFTPPLDGVKKPTQLVDVKIENGKYIFDFTKAAKWVKLAKECGIDHFEVVHLFSQWGVEHPIRIYKNTEFNLTPTNTKFYDKDIELGSQEDKDNLVIDIEGPATSGEYREFLFQFFPAFKAFCEEYGIYDNLYFHVSDEPQEGHLENYKKAFDMLKELKPDIKIMDALSERSFSDKMPIDMPIPSISRETFNDITHGTYFCCGPRKEYINRLMDTPLYKTRMLGSIMYKKNSKFFLHWGYNYYYVSQTRTLIDPYEEHCGGNYPGWAPGDTFVVYPGEDGPLDSIRWENFFDTLQDFDLLSNLEIDPNCEELKDLETFQFFPRDPDFIWDLRKKLLS